MSNISHSGYLELLTDIKQRIRTAQYEALRAVNKELIALYWDIGKSIVEKQKKTGWGKSVVEKLARDLQAEFPGINGFSATNLWYMAQFYTEYHGDEILQPLVGEISWAKHIVIISRCKDARERQFYIMATKKFGWSKNVLIHQIENKSYEKYLLNQTNFDKTVPESIKHQAKLAVKDHYTFDFLVLNDTVKLPHENDAIGIIICKNKKRTIVEYALKTSVHPIGVSTYSISPALPDSYKKLLPDAKTIARKLQAFNFKSGDEEGM